jgi:hypothetical protein
MTINTTMNAAQWQVGRQEDWSRALRVKSADDRLESGMRRAVLTDVMAAPVLWCCWFDGLGYGGTRPLSLSGWQ